ncbi:hypothetical protein E2C01_009170 [Portunus trituberculatus]|uniref:Uncharacterized protein n=1 Tax=Portunus trituberculatus TaxID=210409 RepID=A0A5B7D2R8_PORTR|nr:hypothetical protein [Portunus trituberculatus]
MAKQQGVQFLQQTHLTLHFHTDQQRKAARRDRQYKTRWPQLDASSLGCTHDAWKSLSICLHAIPSQQVTGGLIIRVLASITQSASAYHHQQLRNLPGPLSRAGAQPITTMRQVITREETPNGVYNESSHPARQLARHCVEPY